MGTATTDTCPTMFSGSYDPDDVNILLKSTSIVPVGIDEKERLIQSGVRHYSEMLSSEAVPDQRYLTLYAEALARNAGRLRSDISRLALMIADRPATRRECVVVSLARAGTPIGVLLKRELARLGVDAHHYSISIIRDRGIDHNALRFIASRHSTASAVFVDGWTGKGAIKRELVRSLVDDDLGFTPFLAVVADPAGCAEAAATTDDYVIPSGLLNGIVSGLISRSVLRDDLVGPSDFHACLYQTDHAAHDLTRAFIHDVETAGPPLVESGPWNTNLAAVARGRSRELMEKLMKGCAITDANRIKPGIAEATRAILRRVPDLLLVGDRSDPEVRHLLHLAAKHNVPVRERDLHAYRAVTVIRDLGGGLE